MSAEETAETLGLSVETIKSHRRKAVKKLGAKNLTAAVYQALREGQIKMRPDDA